MRDGHLIRAVSDGPWAILPEKLEAICSVLELHSRAVRVHEKTFEASRKTAPFADAFTRGTGRAQRTVAVMRLRGIIAHRMNMLSDFSGGTSVEKFHREFQSLVDDRTIDSIVIDVDSPGGSVFGIEELAAVVAEAREVKPVIAVANSVMASAAYWIGSAASEVVATPSGTVGSVGIIAVHTDRSEADKQEGIRTTIVQAGQFKGEGHESQPLSDDARSYLQATIDDYYQSFVSAVAGGRGVSVQAVRERFGEGRMVRPSQAIAAGMIDRIATLDEVIAGAVAPEDEQHATAAASVPCLSCVVGEHRTGNEVLACAAAAEAEQEELRKQEARRVIATKRRQKQKQEHDRAALAQSV